MKFEDKIKRILKAFRDILIFKQILSILKSMKFIKVKIHIHILNNKFIY